MRRLLSIVLLLNLYNPSFAGDAARVEGNQILIDGRPFHPWGFNYDRDFKMRLLEEYWHDDWPTVVSDFREMKQMGANTVRIHLQLHEFLATPEQPNQKNLTKLRDLLQLATDTGLKLDLTGLACYRKDKTPAWYATADEAQRWRIQSNFWRAIASACNGSPAVLFYNLINEPLVPHEKRAPGDFLTGHLADFWYCQFITLDPQGRPRDQIARDWIRTMTAAIRAVDQHHLITVGLLPNSTTLAPGHSGFLPATVAPELDLLCTHIYPRKGDDMADDVKTIAAFAAPGKPLVIEETFPMHCSGPELRTFLEKSRPHTTGVLGFYWGQTPADLKPKASLQDAFIAEWYKVFSAGFPK